MQVLLREAIGIAQGDVALFSDYADGGDMWTAKGARERRKRVTFDPPFRAAPMVHVALSLWDTDCKTNARMEVRAENIATDGFDIVFRTWGDSRVARIRAGWIAIGAAHHEDDWRDLE
ncbi:H-type lectin domain-containing protein [Roseovarius ramblicola]|uniref:H-type lectin domain-containing protein n=1 Tax=Roseovarius ramblicola TaxID=2022336 RepID=A0ABV5I519_9RHOB